MARMRPWAAFALVALAVVSERARADEPPPPLTLTWEGPPECSRADSVRADVARLAGPDAARAAPIDARIVASRTARGFRVTLRTTQLGESGERQLEGATCQQVADAAALVLSVMLAPVPTTDTIKEHGFREKPAPAPARTATPEERPKPVPTKRTAFGVGPRVGGDVGTLPRPSLFAGAAFWLSLGSLRPEAGAIIFAPRDTTEGPRRDAGALVGLWAAQARGCLTRDERSPDPPPSWRKAERWRWVRCSGPLSPS